MTNVNAIRNRVSVSRSVSQIYGVPFEKTAFTPQEATQFNNMLATKPPELQLAAAVNFAQGFGEDTNDAAAAFQKTNPMFGYATSLLAADPSMVATASDILRGQNIIKQDKTAGLSTSQFTALDEEWQGYFTSPDQYIQAKKAAESVFAARNIAGSMGDEDLSTIMEEVVGGKKANVGGPVIAPMQVSEDLFEAWAQTLTAERIRQLAGGEVMPSYKGDMFNPEKDAVRLRSYAPNEYFMVGPDGKPLAGKGPNGMALLKITAADIKADNERAVSQMMVNTLERNKSLK
jgi:hypothetical protein